MESQNFLNRLLAKTGRWYIITVLAAIQFVVSITSLFSFIFEQLNADYSPEAEALLNKIEVFTIPSVAIVSAIIP